MSQTLHSRRSEPPKCPCFSPSNTELPKTIFLPNRATKTLWLRSHYHACPEQQFLVGASHQNAPTSLPPMNDSRNHFLVNPFHQTTVTLLPPTQGFENKFPAKTSHQNTATSIPPTHDCRRPISRLREPPKHCGMTLTIHLCPSMYCCQKVCRPYTTQDHRVSLSS